MKNMNIVCLILVIILLAIVIRAATNKGKLWEGEENFASLPPLCCNLPRTNKNYCGNDPRCK